MMKKIFGLVALGLLITPVVCLAQTESGLAPIASEVSLGVASITVGTLAWILAIFILIPASLIGGILRLIGYRYDPKSKGWKFDLKKAAGKLSKYFFYHFVMLFAWVALFSNTSFYYDELQRFGFFQSLFIFIDTHYLAFMIYTLIFAIAGTYLVYYYNLFTKKKTFKPTIYQVLRLFLWNIVFFISLGGIFYIVLNVLF